MEKTQNTQKKNGKKKLLDARGITQIAVLGAVAFVLMMLEIPLWFAPGFYQLDLSELPVLVGSFAMGPLAGVLIELVKVVLYFFLHGSSTLGVGDLANFLIGCSLIVPASLIYARHKSKKHAVAGMAVGTLTMTAADSLINAFVLLPLYATAFGMPMEKLIGMGTAVNPSITGLATFVLLAVAPFNLLKGTVVSLITALIYKKVSPILHAGARKM